MNYISTQAQHTKIINPLRKEGKQTGPRLLVSTAYGIVCPADSPEGASCTELFVCGFFASLLHTLPHHLVLVFCVQAVL